MGMQYSKLSMLFALVTLAAGCSSASMSSTPGKGQAVLPELERPDGPQLPENIGDKGSHPQEHDQAQPPEAQPAEPLALHVTSPVRGERIMGDLVHVEGTVEGGNAPVLTIAGVEVVPSADGSFSADVPAEDGLKTVVTTWMENGKGPEDRRSVLINADADPTVPLDEVVSVNISTAAFAAIGQLMGTYISGLDPAELLQGQPPSDFTVEEITYSGVSVDLVPTDGALEIRFSIRDLSIRLKGKVRVVIRLSVHASMHSNNAVIVARLGVDDDGNGGLAINMQSADVDLQGFSYNIRHVPGAIESWFENKVRKMAEEMMEEAISGVVIPNLFDPDSLSQQIDIMDTQVNMDLGVGDVEMTPQGMVFDLAGTAAAVDIVHDGEAVRSIAAAPIADPSGIDVAIASGFINRILHAIWAGGALDMEVDLASGDAPPTLGFLKAPLGQAAADIPADAPLEVTVRALSPPVAWIDNGADKPIVIQVGNLMLDLGAAGEHLVTISLDLEVRLNLLAENGGFTPEMDVAVNADVAETPKGPVNEAAIENLIEIMAAALPALIVEDADANGADPLPLPMADAPEMSISATGGFIHLLIDLGV